MSHPWVRRDFLFRYWNIAELPCKVPITLASWWFQPIWERYVKLDPPQVGMKIDNIWNHHLVWYHLCLPVSHDVGCLPIPRNPFLMGWTHVGRCLEWPTNAPTWYKPPIKHQLIYFRVAHLYIFFWIQPAYQDANYVNTRIFFQFGTPPILIQQARWPWNTTKWCHYPYNPCMLYLPTFSWFLM